MGDDDLSYFTVSDKKIDADFKRPSIVLFKNFDEGKNIYEGEATVDGLKKFISDNSFATVIVFDDRAIGRIF